MTSREPQQIVPGLTIDSSGTANVDAPLGKLLFDLALQLEDVVPQPVDVEHVLAAIVLAVRCGELDSTDDLQAGDRELLALLGKHLATVFSQYRGQLGRDE